MMRQQRQGPSPLGRASRISCHTAAKGAHDLARKRASQSEAWDCFRVRRSPALGCSPHRWACSRPSRASTAWCRVNPWDRRRRRSGRPGRRDDDRRCLSRDRLERAKPNDAGRSECLSTSLPICHAMRSMLAMCDIHGGLSLQDALRACTLASTCAGAWYDGNLIT